MKKIILIPIAVVILAAAGGVYYLLTNLDSIVEAAIEKYGSEATQTAVRVDNVRITLSEGKARINGLTVANPDGFSGPNAFSLSRISLGIDLDSLGREPIVIDEIGVHAPQVYYEINSDNKDNLRALKRNLGGEHAQAAQPGKPTSRQPRLLIRKVAFEDVALNADIVPLGKSYDVTLPSLRMNQLGAPDGGTPEQIARQVLNELLDRIRTEIDRRGIGRVRQKLDAEKRELEDEADAELEEEKQQAGEKLQKLLDR